MNSRKKVRMSRAAWTWAPVAVLLGIWTAPLRAGDEPALIPVTGIPGGFQAREGVGAFSAEGAPFVGELPLFGMDYAHRAGRREPLRPLAADLSDWAKAIPCPPDRVLVDHKTGRLRFFEGHDPDRFKSAVTALEREMYGDSALGAWKGNLFFLSHWSVDRNLWAYDLADPKHPRKVGETSVPTKTYGLLALPSGLLIVGTERGIHCVDAADPARMKVSPALAPGQWVNPVTPRYLAAWKSAEETTQFQ
jgi:hypothetical protein